MRLMCIDGRQVVANMVIIPTAIPAGMRHKTRLALDSRAGRTAQATKPTLMSTTRVTGTIQMKLTGSRPVAASKPNIGPE